MQTNLPSGIFKVKIKILDFTNTMQVRGMINELQILAWLASNIKCMEDRKLNITQVKFSGINVLQKRFITCRKALN